MGITTEEMGRLTLADIEVMAERFGAAVKTIREAQEMLGGPLSGVRLASQPVIVPAPVHQVGAAPVVFFSPSEQAERAKLLQQFKPEDVEAMERP